MVLHLRASVALPLLEDALHLQATAELTEANETSIPIDLPRVRARALQDVIARVQDRIRPVRDPDPLPEDVVVEEIVLVGMVAEDAEVQAIAVTAAMMIEAGAEVALVVVEEDVKIGPYLTRRAKRNDCTIFSDGV